MKIWILITTVFVSLTGFSQQAEKSEINKQQDTTNSNVKTTVTPAIQTINETYIASYKLTGYRIQLASESSSSPARKIRAAFIQKYKEIPAYEIYQQPYFKVRVGDFKTKLEAIKFQKEIQTDYPNCYIVKDEIVFKKD